LVKCNNSLISAAAVLANQEALEVAHQEIGLLVQPVDQQGIERDGGFVLVVVVGVPEQPVLLFGEPFLRWDVAVAAEPSDRTELPHQIHLLVHLLLALLLFVSYRSCMAALLLQCAARPWLRGYRQSVSMGLCFLGRRWDRDVIRTHSADFLEIEQRVVSGSLFG